MRPKYAVVGVVGVPANYGGFETLVENLVSEDNNSSNEKSSQDFLVFCSSKAYEKKIKSYKNAKLAYVPLNANGIHSIIYDILCLIMCLFYRPAAILVLGVSGAIFMPVLKLFYRGKVVTNIDGLEWRRAKWGKFARRFLKLSESIAVKFSDVVISDNKAIADYVREEYNKESLVIAYGGDHAVSQSNANIDAKDFAFALCRIEPENNVHLILKSFSQTDVKLVFVGNWDSSEYGRMLKRKYSTFENITILDPIYDINKLSVLRGECRFYVHGHSAGGTNPSLVEMMHFSKPILCFDCAYNRATTEEQALYFQNVDSLIQVICEPCFPDDIGEKMLEIATRRYRWSIVRQQYLHAMN
ncbi:glycosyl transferase [Citrobacter amalonaticus]|uniref:Glycosyl transferase n=1 Tax=Citrobacter amalonaticus TaxID=35703 RepID=A0A2S4S4F8_CITAM|nr:glycosyl transferase [Citrobacter amalonaticus]POT78340.1 glycosyl transferase [Citrobacter amalonaticus]POU68730.1 glycosyl transferase [Citrobacter amalonaticus]POV08334.1 glycosyl transferase [Citrobacter amalonaticus]